MNNNNNNNNQTSIKTVTTTSATIAASRTSFTKSIKNLSVMVDDTIQYAHTHQHPQSYQCRQYQQTYTQFYTNDLSKTLSPITITTTTTATATATATTIAAAATTTAGTATKHFNINIDVNCSDGDSGCGNGRGSDDTVMPVQAASTAAGHNIVPNDIHNNNNNKSNNNNNSNDEHLHYMTANNDPVTVTLNTNTPNDNNNDNNNHNNINDNNVNDNDDDNDDDKMNDDLMKLCRSCGKPNNVLYDLFNTTNMKATTIAPITTNTTNIIVSTIANATVTATAMATTTTTTSLSPTLLTSSSAATDKMIMATGNVATLIPSNSTSAICDLNLNKNASTITSQTFSVNAADVAPVAAAPVAAAPINGASPSTMPTVIAKATNSCTMTPSIITVTTTATTTIPTTTMITNGVTKLKMKTNAAPLITYHDGENGGAIFDSATITAKVTAKGQNNMESILQEMLIWQLQKKHEKKKRR